MKQSARVTLLVALASIALGFALTARGVATWDSLGHLDRSRWLVHRFGLPSSRTSDTLLETMKWYGPLWALFLGLVSELPLRWMHDPLWVQQAFNFALFPFGLYAVYQLLRRARVQASTAVLAVAMLFGAIRLGGHALINVNDFPMAMLTLLVTLYLWTALREAGPSLRAGGWTSRGALAWLGIVAMVPYLVRPPVALHPVTLALVLAFDRRGVHEGRGSVLARIERVALPLAAGVLFAFAVWPTLWDAVKGGSWRHGLFGFVHFNWSAGVRYFGQTRMANALPRGYPFIWVPVILAPAAFALLLVGLVRGLVRSSASGHPFAIEMAGVSVEISLYRWLAIHTALLWAAVLVLHPTVYDEERHLLFLYPPLLVLAALGLDGLGARLKLLLAGVVFVTALFAYAGWGRYSYVYKSPLVGDRSANRFMGDYWGVSVPLAVSALRGRVPAGAEVVVPGPFEGAIAQYDRLRAGRVMHLLMPDFGPYRIVDHPSGGPAYVIWDNRNDFREWELDALRKSPRRELWRATMPPGNPASILLEYPDGIAVPGAPKR